MTLALPAIRALLATAVLLVCACAPPAPTATPTRVPPSRFAPTVAAPQAPAPAGAPTDVPPPARADGPVKPAVAPPVAEATAPPPSPLPAATVAVAAVPWNRAKEFVGQSVPICGPVAGTRYASSSAGRPTFLNVGADFPSTNRVTIVIWGRNRTNFAGAPEQSYRGKTVCIEGTVELFQGIPQIEASHAQQIVVQ